MLDYESFKKTVIHRVIDLAETGIAFDKAIDQAIKDFLPIGNLSIEEQDKLSSELLLRFNVKHQTATSIEDDSYQPWVNTVDTDHFYSNRYKELLYKHLPYPTIDTIFKDSRYILDRLGNPRSGKSFKRKGLVVGHVQSGKTANYTALINMAADYGYKLIILIAGIHNNLRSQTQLRINEGFIGYDQEKAESVGVGRYGNNDTTKRPISLTNRQSDFSERSAGIVGFTPEHTNNPVILVIKKNASILRSLKTWLMQDSDEKAKFILNYPALIIDDEADNASINTKDTENDPTMINRLIREVMNLFEKSSYVGYTATPFANIFIDIDAKNDELGTDLFPEHFIINLESPDNYYGPSKFFPSNNTEQFIDPNLDLCEIIDDYFEYIPIPLKNHEITAIPPSLEDAIMHFFLAMAIKELRYPNEHCSMLINISHKTEHHQIVAREVEIFVTKLKNVIRFEGKKSFSIAVKEGLIDRLRKVFNRYFIGIEFDFEQILKQLVDNAYQVEVRQIHSQSNDILNYEDYKNIGLKVIAIGGYSLSRGFTLEKLTTSYFLRNSFMSDTLLQMGRWFGYRDGYADLCKVFLPEKAYNWYSFITQSIEELRDEFRTLRLLNMTPREYGLKVRSCPAGLLITAKNKMLNSSYISKMSFSMQAFNLPQISLNQKLIQSNLNLLEIFIQNLQSYRCDWIPEVKQVPFFYSKVPVSLILNFLTEFIYVDKEDIALCLQYIREGMDKELMEWDVALVSSTQKTVSTYQINGETLYSAKRTPKKDLFSENKDSVMINDGGGRIMRIWEERIGLSEDQLVKAEEKHAERSKKQSAIYYRHFRIRPLLFIRLIDVFNKDSVQPIAEHTVGFAISFPRSVDDRSISYHVNKVYRKQQQLYGLNQDNIVVEED